VPKRKSNDDKFALVIYSALREWNLQPTMEECVEAVQLIKKRIGQRSAKRLPRTFTEPTQTKG